MNDRACDLCGLELGGFPLPLDHSGQQLNFCCEGCLGIYCMLHGVATPTDQAESQSPNTNAKGA